MFTWATAILTNCQSLKRRMSTVLRRVKIGIKIKQKNDWNVLFVGRMTCSIWRPCFRRTHAWGVRSFSHQNSMALSWLFPKSPGTSTLTVTFRSRTESRGWRRTESKMQELLWERQVDVPDWEWRRKAESDEFNVSIDLQLRSGRVGHYVSSEVTNGYMQKKEVRVELIMHLFVSQAILKTFSQTAHCWNHAHCQAGSVSTLLDGAFLFTAYIRTNMLTSTHVIAFSVFVHLKAVFYQSSLKSQFDKRAIKRNIIHVIKWTIYKTITEIMK